MNRKHNAGSVTVEAAIVFPFFLMVLVSMLMLVRICSTYNAVQFALQETARKIAGVSYLYHLSGVNDLSKALEQTNSTAKPAMDEMIQQAMDFANEVQAFSIRQSAGGEVGTNKMEQALEQLQSLSKEWKETDRVLQEILKDPKKQMDLVAAVFAQPVVGDFRNLLFRTLSQTMLASSLSETTNTEIAHLGQKLRLVEGLSGLNLSASNFSEDNKLDLIVTYQIKGVDLFGIWRYIPLCNRVHMTAWTGGVGDSLRVLQTDALEEQETNSQSMWNAYDDNQQYRRRGSNMEILELAGLKPEDNRSILAEQHHSQYSAYADYVTLDTEAMVATAYQFFTINPYMKTYQENHAALGKRMQVYAEKLMCFNQEMADARVGYGESKSLKRVLVMIVPENAEPWVREEFERMASQLRSLGVDDIRFVGAYGDYIVPKEEGSDQSSYG